MGTLRDVGDTRDVRRVARPLRSLELAVCPRGGLAGGRELELAHGMDVDVLGHDQTLRDRQLSPGRGIVGAWTQSDSTPLMQRFPAMGRTSGARRR